MFLLIDNYDSFVYNLRHYMGEVGADVVEPAAGAAERHQRDQKRHT